MKAQDSILQQNLRHAVLNQIAEEQSISSRVIDAMKAVPRQYFVSEELWSQTYDDKPLPIASGQTISQITTVAIQTDLLDAHPGNKVLEIGTGSGYQAAILAKLGCKVFTIERIYDLWEIANENIDKLDFKSDIVTVFADGYDGLAQFGPYDRIIVTCGAPSVPEKLMSQLTIGGKMVIPVGEKMQEMLVVEKIDDEEYSTTSAGRFTFVPMLKGVVKQ